MIETTPWWWMSVALAAILLGDALLSIRPPRFISDCLEGVGFPRDWWWALVAVKLLAVAGLLAGLVYPGIGAASAMAVAGYFVCAAVAHVRAGFLGQSFWVNCLGMLALSIVVVPVAYTI
ncbi:DoxX family protein [Rhodococcus rhodochrous]|uniref:DoxX family protein n=1 Tax=Rhodococcus rhodochrous TaxID=1829 RepID=UPI001E3DBB23|nr:DoxX family protein [Rhodococcus rhodochrous]MCD2100208.1 DoxX family protein [Rhodococcus rhodochrous]MCD2124590.1 DoxX family protein [Rhodococcus rhodochrous]MCQ4137580.1 DoxX family protein [Rhodococcus rhodochrous]MDJ0021362.1 DoxX family protein [Rhodococcus rhodochrous]